MDYFKQRREYRKLKRDQIDISTGQNNLYRELLDYANDEGVLDRLFTLKNSALIDLTGLSEAGLKKARNELVLLGLIEYIPGKRNKQKPQYKIIQLYHTSWATKTNKSSSTGTATSSSTSSPVSSSTGSSKVLTSTRHIPDFNKVPSARAEISSPNQSQSLAYFLSLPYAIKLKENNSFGLRRDLDDLNQDIADYGDELFLEALKLGADKNKPLPYAESILASWAEKGIKKVADLKRATKQKPKVYKNSEHEEEYYDAW